MGQSEQESRLDSCGVTRHVGTATRTGGDGRANEVMRGPREPPELSEVGTELGAGSVLKLQPLHKYLSEAA